MSTRWSGGPVRPCLLVVIVLQLSSLVEPLLFPRYSVLQITAAVSVPVEIPHRRIFTDWGFQMNYDMPWNLTSFYNVPIWPNQAPIRYRRDVDDWESSRSDLHKKYETTSATNRHPNDFSAGELYMGFEDLLVSYGYHETCLLKSVCELARHPFDDVHHNILTQILTFVLSPSMHEGFADSEVVYRETYEEAERLGFLGEDCDNLYADCRKDFLNLVTEVIFPKG